MKVVDELNLLDIGSVVGNHSAWLPKLKIKVPFQYGGRITKYRRVETTFSLESLGHEVAILSELSKHGMAPKIGDWVYFKSVISEHSGAWHIDPCGAYGYEMEDANSLPKGNFSIEFMKTLPIVGSSGAWSDIMVNGRENVVNGYLVDVRRSAFDMFRWSGKIPELAVYDDPVIRIKDDVCLLGAFPKGERSEPYQDYYLDGLWYEGSRRVKARADAFEFCPKYGESVLEIGCQTGGFESFAYLSGSRRIVGVDVDKDYIDLCRRLARKNRHNMCFRNIDACSDDFMSWVECYFPNGVDHLLILSMYKHVKPEWFYRWMDEINARNVYIESNALKPNEPPEFDQQIKQRGGLRLSDTSDRNPRAVYRIVREKS